MGPLKAFRELLTELKQAKQKTLDLLALEEDIRRKRITEAADLDHGYLRKIMEAMPSGTEVRIILRSGETVELYKQGGFRPETVEGPGW